MNYPTTRKEAQATGSKYYYTGVPCKHGHTDLRLVKGTCVICRQIEWQQGNEKRKQKPKTEAAKESGRRYYERNRTQVIARAQARPIEDKKRYKKAHKIANTEYYKVLTSLRRRRHKNATPQWLTYSQKRDIKNLYVQAVTLSRITGVQYVVDHEIPLNGEQVCGLHVPWNLRVITQEENLVKSNKHES